MRNVREVLDGLTRARLRVTMSYERVTTMRLHGWRNRIVSIFDMRWPENKASRVR